MTYGATPYGLTKPPTAEPATEPTDSPDEGVTTDHEEN